MSSLEQITYGAGRHALADQQTTVSEIRRQTGTLLAAHALVASFLGAAAVRGGGLNAPSWIALTSLVLGLCASAALLAPRPLRFAVDSQVLYSELLGRQGDELCAAGFGYQALRERNARTVRRLVCLSGSVGVLVIAQTVSWLTALALE